MGIPKGVGPWKHKKPVSANGQANTKPAADLEQGRGIEGTVIALESLPVHSGVLETLSKIQRDGTNLYLAVKDTLKFSSVDVTPRGEHIGRLAALMKANH